MCSLQLTPLHKWLTHKEYRDDLLLLFLREGWRLKMDLWTVWMDSFFLGLKESFQGPKNIQSPGYALHTGAFGAALALA